jgi:tRNA (guanine37-N1)-methyltransferase
MFDAITKYGVTGRASANGIYRLHTWNPREFTEDNHRTVDDRPYGGGPGMVMLVEPLERAIMAARSRQSGQISGGPAGARAPKVIYLSPQGRPLNHEVVLELCELPALVLLAGRYEGVDERLIERQVDYEISIGDYVLSGGELAAMVLIDCMVRQMPGVLGDPESASLESFTNVLLDFPQYTRPEVYCGAAVPDVLMSGDHARIKRWRLQQSLGRTWLRRPDLLALKVERGLSGEEKRLLEEFQQSYETN